MTDKINKQLLDRAYKTVVDRVRGSNDVLGFDLCVREEYQRLVRLQREGGE